MHSCLSASKRRSSQWILGLFVLLLTAITAFPQTPAKTKASVITIDGSRDPDRIPDWILWGEVFRMALVLSEKTPDAAPSIWMEKLHL